MQAAGHHQNRLDICSHDKVELNRFNGPVLMAVLKPMLNEFVHSSQIEELWLTFQHPISKSRCTLFEGTTVGSFDCTNFTNQQISKRKLLSFFIAVMNLNSFVFFSQFHQHYNAPSISISKINTFINELNNFFLGIWLRKIIPFYVFKDHSRWRR